MLQCSRKLTQAEIDAKREECLRAAANGTVYVSAAISEGEKQISRALREAGYEMIILLTEGFPAADSPHYKYFKPQGVYFQAAADRACCGDVREGGDRGCGVRQDRHTRPAAHDTEIQISGTERHGRGAVPADGKIKIQNEPIPRHAVKRGFFCA